jgi:sulfatase modifying factor 1
LVAVASFLLDRRPVTNGEFARFLRSHPEWRRSQVKPLFADSHYLEHWQGDALWPKAASADQPVTNVSWFAATAYCEARGANLPTTDQWEYALADGGRNEERRREQILAWYSVPNRAALPSVRRLAANGYGVQGLVGAVWEWTEDFNSVVSGPELRESGIKNRDLFCGGASISAKDASDYAAFMRFSMRVSLKATYATDNLGFRCASEVPS